MSFLLGCIADDFTGATDLANTLTRHGMRTVQAIGVPKGDAPPAEAIVVALKTRTASADEAVSQSIEACRWLKAKGARQIFFKYCSTFDSTDKGNIGPVGDALLDELKTPFTIACPAFPENGRRVFLGHLFVGNDLLSDSSMRHHPLTPMLDSSLVRVLARQSAHMVGLVPLQTVSKGAGAIAQAFKELQKARVRHAIVDAIEDTHLEAIGEACADLPLVTGGSGVALGLPENFRRAGILPKRDEPAALPKQQGSAAVLAGSCSAATLEQVATMQKFAPSLALDPITIAANLDDEVRAALAWVKPRLAHGPVLIYSTANPQSVSATQHKLGREAAGVVIERAMALIAIGLVEAGVRRIVVAGGETSGAVVSALGIKALDIGPQIAPGVPATLAYGEPRVALALKSGNFGGPDFFREAIEVL